MTLIRFLIGVATAALLATAAIGAPSTTPTTGQPNQSCQTSPGATTPGNSASAAGSAFNPDGIAGTKYAGAQPQNQKNPVSVSQYDVACTRPQH